jgi:hypothetical protein
MTIDKNKIYYGPMPDDPEVYGCVQMPPDVDAQAKSE